MENRDDLRVINSRMSDLWARMVQARVRGDWTTYWNYRHAWLAAGRLLSLLQAERLELEPEQLALVPPETGRAHDAAF